MVGRTPRKKPRPASLPSAEGGFCRGSTPIFYSQAVTVPPVRRYARGAARFPAHARGCNSPPRIRTRFQPMGAPSLPARQAVTFPVSSQVFGFQFQYIQQNKSARCPPERTNTFCHFNIKPGRAQWGPARFCGRRANFIAHEAAFTRRSWQKTARRTRRRTSFCPRPAWRAARCCRSACHRPRT